MARWRWFSSWYVAPAGDRSLVVGEGQAHGVARLLAGRRPVPDAGRLEHGPGAGHVADRVGVGARDADAAVGLAGGQTLGHEQREGLAQGRPGDAERLGERDLAQRRTGLQLALEDGSAQLLGHPVDRRGVLEAEGAEGVRGTLERVHDPIV